MYFGCAGGTRTFGDLKFGKPMKGTIQLLFCRNEMAFNDMLCH